MIEPGKQHNFRVLTDAKWTDDFNRLLAVSGLSANKLINHLIQTGLATLDITGEKQRLAFVTTHELEFLIEKRLSGERLVLDKNASKPSLPVETDPLEEEASSMVSEELVEESPAPASPRKPSINTKRKGKPKVSVPDSVKSSFEQYKAD